MSGYKAVTYVPSSPDAEYFGWSVLTVTQNLRADIIRPLMEKYGLADVDPNAFYLQGALLAALKEVEQNFTFEELVALGIKTADLLPVPPELNSVEALIAALPVLYKSTCRNIPEEEGVTVEKVHDKHYRLIHNSPLPPFMLYATVFGLVRRVKQKGQNPLVELTQMIPPVIMDIRW